jgi:Flp pilus assembly protein TadG
MKPAIVLLPHRSWSRRCGTRRGGLLPLYPFLLITLTGLCTLAVDFGHLQVAKMELHSAADAAAIAAAEQLENGTAAAQEAAAVTAAIQIAGANLSDGQPIPVFSSDVTFGNWDLTQTPNFSGSRLPVNAVSVTTHRDTSHGNPLFISWGTLLGLSACNVADTAIAQVNTTRSTYGIVGINHVNFGSLGVLASIEGDVVSDGDINIGTPLGLLVGVTGNAQSFGGTVTHGGLAHISGSTSALKNTLSYPSVQLPATNNNNQIAGNLNAAGDFDALLAADIPAGTYVVHDLNFLAGLAVNFEGPVTFYVTGCFNMAATINLLGQNNTSPANFNVLVTPGGSVNFLANLLTPLYMNLYAPDSPISLSVGLNQFNGSIIGKTLDINLPVAGTFVEQKLGNQFTICLVQ